MMVFWKVLEVLGVFFNRGHLWWWFDLALPTHGGSGDQGPRRTNGRGSSFWLGGCLGHSVHGKSWGTWWGKFRRLEFLELDMGQFRRWKVIPHWDYLSMKWVLSSNHHYNPATHMITSGVRDSDANLDGECLDDPPSFHGLLRESGYQQLKCAIMNLGGNSDGSNHQPMVFWHTVNYIITYNL